ncbi:Os10g0131750 [Oryza sativa Japonica Group]|uniref:Os10g0131750 protein n=1 Tax=Oryza sativa subsp. japonica TaxID=39947 RepID=A0A0P0XS63_ORYSJ|nr:hypothetical protein EE612_049879 [Oryza sativa]BAT09771.1 Os10g0131750 [Oryza sativa Japonica Group]
MANNVKFCSVVVPTTSSPACGTCHRFGCPCKRFTFYHVSEHFTAMFRRKAMPIVHWYIEAWTITAPKQRAT